MYDFVKTLQNSSVIFKIILDMNKTFEDSSRFQTGLKLFQTYLEHFRILQDNFIRIELFKTLSDLLMVGTFLFSRLGLRSF